MRGISIIFLFRFLLLRCFCLFEVLSVSNVFLLNFFAFDFFEEEFLCLFELSFDFVAPMEASLDFRFVPVVVSTAENSQTGDLNASAIDTSSLEGT